VNMQEAKNIMWLSAMVCAGFSGLCIIQFLSENNMLYWLVTGWLLMFLSGMCFAMVIVIRRME
jgi:hypothetical protein